MFAFDLWIWLETLICQHVWREEVKLEFKSRLLSSTDMRHSSVPRAFYFADICKKSLYIIKADFCLKLIYETFISAPQSPYLKSSSVLLFSFFFWWNGAKVTEKWLHCQNFATYASFLGKIWQQKKSVELTFARKESLLSQLQCVGRFLWN